MIGGHGSRTGRDARLLLGVILIATVGQGMVIPFLFVYLTQVRHLDATVAGFVAAWLGLAGLLLAAPAGVLVDRVGSRRVFVVLVAVYACGVAGWALVHTPWQAFAVGTLASVGGAPLLGAYNTLLSTAAAPAEQQRFFGLAFAALNLGLGIGGLIGGAVADEHRPSSFQMLYVLDAAALMASALLVLIAVRAGDRTIGASEQSAIGGYRQVLRDAPFRRFLALGVVLMSCSYAQFEFGLPAFAVEVAHVSPRVIGWSFAANSITIVATQTWVLRRIEHRSRTKVLSIAGIIFATAWLILALGAATGSVSAAAPVAGVATCAVVFALAEVLMSPVIPALTNVLASDAYRGRYNALSSMLFSATAIIGPLTAAPLIGHGLSGFWTVLVVGGSLTAAALALRLRRHLTPQQDGIASIAEPHGE